MSPKNNENFSSKIYKFSVLMSGCSCLISPDWHLTARRLSILKLFLSFSMLELDREEGAKGVKGAEDGREVKGIEEGREVKGDEGGREVKGEEGGREFGVEGEAGRSFSSSLSESSPTTSISCSSMGSKLPPRPPFLAASHSRRSWDSSTWIPFPSSFFCCFSS